MLCTRVWICIKRGLLNVYNYGKLFITITRETATEWVYLCDNEHLINDSLLYSDKKLRHEYSKEFSSISLPAKTVRYWNKSDGYCFSCKKVQLYGFK